ncbi:hypothetical protein Tco_1148152, partial [Tanacetum coccineum]
NDDNEIFDVDALAGEEVFVAEQSENIVEEPGESTTTTTPISSKIQDKGKRKMVEPEPVKKLSKKDQLKLDEEIALKLQAEIDEEERLAREKAQQIKKANIVWDDVQAKVEADYQLAQRLQAQEQEELTDEEKVYNS